MEGKKKYYGYIAVFVVVLLIALVVYMMIVSKKREASYNNELSKKIGDVIDSVNTPIKYEIRSENDGTVIKGDILVGVSTDVSAVDDEIKSAEALENATFFKREGKNGIEIYIGRPTVISHELSREKDDEKITEKNDKDGRIMVETERELVTDELIAQTEKRIEKVLKTLLESMKYNKVKVKFIGGEK